MGTAAPVLVQQTREWNAMMADMEATRWTTAWAFFQQDDFVTSTDI